MEEVKPGWYINTQTSLQQYWDGTQWLDIPAPTHIEGQPIAVQKAETSDLAVIALVLSFAVPFVGWFLGFKARKDIADSQGKKSGAPLATAAIWIGGVATVAIATMLAFCTIASVSFGNRFGDGFGDRGIMNHRMFLGGNTYSYGYDDGSGRIPMMGSSSSSGSGTITINPNGGMMYNDQGDQGGVTSQSVPVDPNTSTS
jgi:hypothetical protein